VNASTSSKTVRHQKNCGDSCGEIYAIYLDPREWRKGYGLALVKAAMEALKAQGFSEVTLWVLDKNERGIGFYEAMGFRADGAGKVEKRRNGVESYEVRYRRYLEDR
jgi:ribosomal protein S18 acetylase RimI-like enzyme